MDRANQTQTVTQNEALVLPGRAQVASWRRLTELTHSLQSVYQTLALSSTRAIGDQMGKSGAAKSLEREFGGNVPGTQDRPAHESRVAHLKVSSVELEKIKSICESALPLSQGEVRNDPRFKKVEKRLATLALSALLSFDRKGFQDEDSGATPEALARAKKDLLTTLREHELLPVASALRMTHSKIRNRSFDSSFFEDRQVAFATIKCLASFLICKRLSGSFKVSPLDVDIRELLQDITRGMQGAHKMRIEPTKPGHVYDREAQPSALDVLKAAGTAVDMLLVCNNINKLHMSDSCPAGVDEGRENNIAKGDNDELRMPSAGTENSLAGRIGTLLVNGTRLPCCTETERMRGLTDVVVTSREALILQTTGSLDVLDSLLISCQDALAQLASLASGSAPLYQGDVLPNPRFTASLLEKLRPRLGVDPRSIPNPNPIKMDGFLAAVQRMESNVQELGEHFKVGGGLVGGLFHGLSHQVPRGIDPLAPVFHSVSVGTNGAHVGMTHFPRLEHSINELVRKPGVLFDTPWSEGVGIPTSGGTASNNLAAHLAFSGAGCGLALKEACEKLDMDVTVSLDGKDVSLIEIDDTRALMLHPENMSAAIRRLGLHELNALRNEFKTALQSVQRRYPPIVVIPEGEWVHYTLERQLCDLAGEHLLRIPSNERTELDFGQLQQEIEERFKDGPRPVILPLTFCNTGLGRSGCDVEGVPAFMSWFSDTYGAPPLVVVDAAQGGLTFGIDKRRLLPEIVAAREMLAKFSMSFTLDPHKSSLPLPCSIWVVKDPAWAMFATGRGVSHSYLESSDATELREATQLSTPLESAMIAWKFLKNLETGEHNEIFAPVLQSAEDAFVHLKSNVTRVVIDGREYRMIAPFEPHSGILCVCFVPLDGDMSMEAANNALKRVREVLIDDRNSPISCSGYSLDMSAFRSPDKVKERFSNGDLRWDGIHKLEFLRFVFGQGGQDRVVIETLPRLISERFSIS